ncbi:DUF4468 domain-containing protein [Epilithonimonas sp.]|uniref:DUF4468 domain-containing protein n=1 Tax=Epilithonimonas sp. TaxID=2894511 RepID=UPI00289C9D23|nr:DUF4468 domain-containing protein [Epilithonimonas sp.]
MKKYIFLLSATLTSTVLFGQDATPQQEAPPTEFSVSKEQQLTDFIVVPCEGKTKEELYKKTLEWISKTYNKPSEVIRAQVENDYVRFQGIETKGYCRNPMVMICEDMQYEVEVSVKDGKYKFDVVKLESAETNKYGRVIGWGAIEIKKGWMHFKSNGEVRDQYKDTMPKIARYINSLNKSLHDYIYNQNETAKSNNW